MVQASLHKRKAKISDISAFNVGRYARSQKSKAKWWEQQLDKCRKRLKRIPLFKRRNYRRRRPKKFEKVKATHAVGAYQVFLAAQKKGKGKGDLFGKGNGLSKSMSETWSDIKNNPGRRRELHNYNRESAKLTSAKKRGAPLCTSNAIRIARFETKRQKRSADRSEEPSLDLMAVQPPAVPAADAAQEGSQPVAANSHLAVQLPNQTQRRPADPDLKDIRERKVDFRRRKAREDQFSNFHTTPQEQGLRRRNFELLRLQFTG